MIMWLIEIKISKECDNVNLKVFFEGLNEMERRMCATIVKAID